MAAQEQETGRHCTKVPQVTVVGFLPLLLHVDKEGFVIPVIPLPRKGKGHKDKQLTVLKSAVIKAGQFQGKYFILSQRFEGRILPQDPQTRSTPWAVLIHTDTWEASAFRDMGCSL